MITCFHSTTRHPFYQK